MDFKRYVLQISCVSFDFLREPRRRTEGGRAGVVDEPDYSGELRSTSAVLQNKDSILRIVLAGRMVEVYNCAVPAYMVMDKYPGLRLARPEVFKRPHDSLVGPREMLFPGQKFYLVPESTFKKLKEKYPEVMRLDKADSSEKIMKENECAGEEEERPEEQKKRPFKKIITRQVLVDGWRPRLSTIEELSP